MMKNHSYQVDDILHLLHHIQSMYSYHICYPTVHHTILEHDQLCYTVMCYHYSVAVLLQHYLDLYKHFPQFQNDYKYRVITFIKLLLIGELK